MLNFSLPDPLRIISEQFASSSWAPAFRHSSLDFRLAVTFAFPASLIPPGGKMISLPSCPHHVTISRILFSLHLLLSHFSTLSSSWFQIAVVFTFQASYRTASLFLFHPVHTKTQLVFSSASIFKLITLQRSRLCDLNSPLCSSFKLLLAVTVCWFLILLHHNGTRYIFSSPSIFSFITF